MKKLSVILLCVVATTACTYQKSNKFKQDDLRQGDEWVYGVHPDSAARQLQNKYTEKPESQAKADEVKEILYPKGK